LTPFIRVNLFAIPRYGNFLFDWIRIRQSGGNAPVSKVYPCLFDRTGSTGIDRHYFYQAVWAFQKIAACGPEVHVDVGSQANYVGMLTALTRVIFVDIRPLDVEIENYTFRKGTIVNLPFEDETVSSLSCLHVAEHIGLGRYGYPIDPDGTIKACGELSRVLAPGGNLYFSLPVGKEAVYFNAHRVHSVEQILRYFGKLTLKEFSVVDDNGLFIRGGDPKAFDSAEYANGLFHFVK
jgi:SAM-dependent methyltransferase